MKVKVKKIYENAMIPTRGSEYAAGYDLYAFHGDLILPGATNKIETGIAMEIPDGYVGLIFARSGLATKKGLRPANCVGVIDSDYRGEIIVALHNDSDQSQVVDTNDRVAQIAILPYLSVDFEEVDILSETTRGEGGFGSTGINTNSN